MDVREKLIELLENANYQCENRDCDEDAEGCAYHCYANCWAQFVADNLIANGVTVQEWIPVSERLPEKGEGTVLVCGSRGGIYTAYLERSGKYPKWHKLNSKNHYCEPTHWMPLPQPPKGA